MDETALSALFVQLIRSGDIGEAVIHDAADECEAAGNSSAAHQLRCLIVHAHATPASELVKRRARARLRSIDGGNLT